jgi:hypothetical protein
VFPCTLASAQMAPKPKFKAAKEAGKGQAPSKPKHKLSKTTRKLNKQQQQAADAAELKELERRVVEEAPAPGSNPLAEDLTAPPVTNKKVKLDAGGEPEQDSAEEEEAEEKESDEGKSAASSSSSSSSSTSSAAAKAKQHKLFSSLPLSSRTQTALEANEFTQLTDIQRAAIPHALAGRDILGAAKTGAAFALSSRSPSPPCAAPSFPSPSHLPSFPLLIFFPAVSRQWQNPRVSDSDGREAVSHALDA